MSQFVKIRHRQDIRRCLGAMLCAAWMHTATAQDATPAAVQPAAPVFEEIQKPADDTVQAGVAAIVEEGGEGPLTYSEALTTVWTTNPEVRQAELALQATDYEVSGSRTGYFPFVVLQNEADKDGNSGLVRLVQPLWNGGLTGAQVDRAKAGQMAALAELNLARLNVGVRASDAYLNLVAAQDASVQWADYIKELNRLLQIIQRRTAEGVAPQADVETAQTRLSQAKAGAQANRAVLESNRALLATLLNLDPGAVAWPSERRKLTDEEAEGAGSRGIAAHPQRQLALAQVRQQQAVARASKAQLWPQLNAEYRRALQDFSTDSGNDDTALLTLTYQTDNGLRGYQQYKADQQRAVSAKAAFDVAARNVEAQIRTARAERSASLIQIVVQAEAVESSRALVASFFRQFEVGRKSWLEVLNALRESNETILQAVAVKRNFWLANGRLALQGLYWRRLSEGAPTIDVIQLEKDK